jgi:hypothetical protein
MVTPAPPPVPPVLGAPPVPPVPDVPPEPVVVDPEASVVAVVPPEPSVPVPSVTEVVLLPELEPVVPPALDPPLSGAALVQANEPKPRSVTRTVPTASMDRYLRMGEFPLRRWRVNVVLGSVPKRVAQSFSRQVSSKMHALGRPLRLD